MGNDTGNWMTDEPNSTIMIRGLPVYILEQDVRKQFILRKCLFFWNLRLE